MKSRDRPLLLVIQHGFQLTLPMAGTEETNTDRAKLPFERIDQRRISFAFGAPNISCKLPWQTMLHYLVLKRQNCKKVQSLILTSIHGFTLDFFYPFISLSVLFLCQSRWIRTHSLSSGLLCVDNFPSVFCSLALVASESQSELTIEADLQAASSRFQAPPTAVGGRVWQKQFGCPASFGSKALS